MPITPSSAHSFAASWYAAWSSLILLAMLQCVGCGAVEQQDPETAGAVPQGAPESGTDAGSDPMPAPERYVNSIGIELILIQPGEFTMGIAPGPGGGNATERPHQVRITRPFMIARTEVTQSQWTAIMGANPSRYKGDGLPVQNVSWLDAVEFCRRLSEQEGQTHRLPTEAEWEYACRAGTTTSFSFGDDDRLVGDFVWYNGNARGVPKPVGTKRPNPWGLYDMSGNVREWCADWFAWRYPTEPQTDPLGPANGTERVRRGGACDFYSSAGRSGARDSCPPDLAYDDLGFRVVMDVPQEGSPTGVLQTSPP